MNRIVNNPLALAAARRGKAALKYSTYTLPGLLLTSQAFAQAAGNTLGGRIQSASGDLTTGGTFLMEMFGYILGAAAILTGFYTIWQHTKNPNGQSRLGYGLCSLIIGGAFLSASLWGSFASNTVAGGGVTNTGVPKAMTFQ